MFGLVSADFAEAADKKDKDNKRNAQIIQQMRQQQATLEAEKQAKDAELAEKEKALQEASLNAAEAGGSLVKVKSQLTKSNSELGKIKASLAEMESELSQTKNELEELKQQYQEALASLEFNDKQRKTQVQNVAQTTKLLNECAEKNQLLYAQGKSLIKIYENPSLYEHVMRKEKFFQLKRVELENILQDKLNQLDDANVSVN
jgi:chromosome segregation ATPase